MTPLPATLPAMRSQPPPPPPPLSHTCPVSFHPARSQLSSRLRCSSPGAHFSSLMSTASLCGWAESGDIYQYGEWLACECVFPPLRFFFPLRRRKAASYKLRDPFLKLTCLLWITKRPPGPLKGRTLKFTVSSACPASAAKHNVGRVTTILTNSDLTRLGLHLIASHIQLQMR